MASWRQSETYRAPDAADERPAPRKVGGQPVTPQAGALPSLVPLLSGRQKLVQGLGIAVWLVALVQFWVWWLQPEHNIGSGRFVLVSAALAWVTLLPLYFLAIFVRGRRMSGPVRLPPGSRVAIVVTKAPSEPFAVVARTMEAMLRQRYPHDTWLADEDPDAETLAWCAARGVRVSTRRGVADYHRLSWPRRTRCKEGNLAYFYDHYGYDGYDFVVQLDADHVPTDTYLEEMLKPFADPAVGYVSAPSICDANAASSWSARCRLYVEGPLHGALQAGYNAGLAPLCIGSHYGVRTAALKEIGGLGPELAEDHSTTLMMNAHGWRGVHAVDAIAHGNGPECFADLVTQEFQWSRSIVSILLNHMPDHVAQLPWRIRLQFLFSEVWYPLFALSMLIAYALPILALVSGHNIVGVTFAEFLLHFLPLPLILIGLAFTWRNSGWCRPHDCKVLSWEGSLFVFIRWPWALLGSLAALRDWVSGGFVDYRVTPKGSTARDAVPFRVIAPYLVLSGASAVTALLLSEAGEARGHYLFAAVNAAIYASIVVVVLYQHAREARLDWVAHWPRLTVQAGLAGVIAAMPVMAFALRGPAGLDAIAWGVPGLQLTRVTHSVAGAGLHRRPTVTLEPRWIRQQPASSPGRPDGRSDDH